MKSLHQSSYRYAENRRRLIHERNRRLLGATVEFNFHVLAQIGDQVDGGLVCVSWSGENHKQYVRFDELCARFLEPEYVTRVKYSKKVLLKDYFA